MFSEFVCEYAIRMFLVLMLAFCLKSLFMFAQGCMQLAQSLRCVSKTQIIPGEVMRDITKVSCIV